MATRGNKVSERVPLADGGKSLAQQAPVTVVGATSAAGQAYCARSVNQLLARVSRRSGQAAIEVGSYLDVPEGLIQPGSTIVNLVGANSTVQDTLESVNVDVPLRWAAAAKAAGAAHFVQLSSFSVYGRTETIDATTAEHPTGPYGASKLKADRALLELQSETFGVTILRVPMLFGREKPGRMESLVRAALRFRHLPITSPPIARSMLTYGNLAVALEHVVAQRTLGILHAAERDTFSFSLLAEVMASRGRPLRLVTAPALVLAPVRLLWPEAGRRLFASSRLQSSANSLSACFEDGALAAEIGSIVDRCLARASR